MSDPVPSREEFEVLADLMEEYNAATLGDLYRILRELGEIPDTEDAL